MTPEMNKKIFGRSGNKLPSGFAGFRYRFIPNKFGTLRALPIPNA